MEHLDMRRKVIIMISIMAALFFASVNQTIVGNALPPQMQDIFTQIVVHLRDAMSYSLSGVFFTGVIIMALSVLLTVFLKEVPLRTSVQKHDNDEQKQPKAEPARSGAEHKEKRNRLVQLRKAEVLSQKRRFLPLWGEVL
ncbi:hypothetical protein [Ectobacillus panaciterrae]|uniref:hypothetical protein n=1 Tax=Ectobacillus panaciterrae TaxID=363872 RepID=UPI000417395D|nr:hypothetical protein [Ectobacillus panaciterrae]